jgi:hypothetical protein
MGVGAGACCVRVAQEPSGADAPSEEGDTMHGPVGGTWVAWFPGCAELLWAGTGQLGTKWLQVGCVCRCSSVMC